MIDRFKASRARFHLSAAAALLLPWVALALAGCRGPASTGDLPTPATPNHLFTEITAELGLEPTPQPWPDGKYYTPEIAAGGVAVFDYDGDGDLDI